MSRSRRAEAAIAMLVLGSASLAIGCGASRPRADDIYHDPALRRGTFEADDADRELLARLDGLPAGEPVTIAGRVYVAAAPYHAASGRTCRTVQGSSVQGSSVRGAANAQRLACASEDARWEFVPDVFGGENPFAIEERGGEPSP